MRLYSLRVGVNEDLEVGWRAGPGCFSGVDFVIWDLDLALELDSVGIDLRRQG